MFTNQISGTRGRKLGKLQEYRPKQSGKITWAVRIILNLQEDIYAGLKTQVVVQTDLGLRPTS